MRLKRIIIFAAMIVLFAGLAFAAREIKFRADERKEKQAATEILKEFSNICLQKFPAKSDSEKIRNLRHCLYINTKFSTDKAYTELWNDSDKIAAWLLAYTSKKYEIPPPMECSNRAGTLVVMLQALGYKAHDVVLARNEDNFDDHVVTEVLNPDTGKWEIQGPSYDVEYVSVKVKNNLDLKQMLSMDTGEYMPCDFKGDCGWHLKNTEGFTLDYNRGYWNTGWVKADKTLYISTKRFDENKPRPVYGRQLSYCQWREKWCNNVVHLD